MMCLTAKLCFEPLKAQERELPPSLLPSTWLKDAGQPDCSSSSLSVLLKLPCLHFLRDFAPSHQLGGGRRKALLHHWLLHTHCIFCIPCTQVGSSGELSRFSFPSSFSLSFPSCFSASQGAFLHLLDSAVCQLG